MERHSFMALVNVDFWSDKRVLVTGASGYKGSVLAEALRRAGAYVFGLTRRRRSRRSFFCGSGLQERIDTANIDITNSSQLREVINSVDPDVIFHLAAKALVPVCRREPRSAFEVNVMGTVNLLQACRDLGFSQDKTVLITSTDHVPAHREVANGTGVGQFGPYDASKSAQELAVESYVELYRQTQFPSVMLTRCVNVFGPGDVNLRRIVPEFITSARTQGHISPAYPQNSRQYIYVLDAVLGYLLAVEQTHQTNKCLVSYGFAPQGPPITAIELARRIASALGSEAGQTVTVSDRREKGDYAPNELRSIALDASPASNLGWIPRVSLEAGLIEVYRWDAAEEPELAGLADQMWCGAAWLPIEKNNCGHPGE